MASKKASKTSAPKVNKSEWIRSQPTDMPAADVVAAAKKAGISITTGQVYTTRSDSKKKAGTSAPKSKPGPKPKSAAAASGGSLEELVRAIVRDEVRRYFVER